MGGLPFIRLPKKACALISNQVKNLDKNAEVYVIGSRADCLKRGGDIDILIISNVFSSDNKRDLRFSLEDMLGEQQIDIAVYKDKTPPFVQLTLNTAVKI
ncbi:MAG: nucleotidyltransferase domain-containing protein [Bdellovibrionota bacterium]